MTIKLCHFVFIPFILSSFVDCSSRDLQECGEEVKGVCVLAQHCYTHLSSESPLCLSGEVCCLSTGISEKKCIEYSEQEDGVVTLRDSNEERFFDCPLAGVPLIIGGTPASLQEFPHMAAISFASNWTDGKWLCGGTLISERYVVTAAHCIDNEQLLEAKWISLGAVKDLSEPEDDTGAKQIFSIKEFTLHPDYSSFEYFNDIALLELSSPVEFTSAVRPACLLTSPLHSSKVTATGWGKTEIMNERGHNELMKVDIDYLHSKDCSAYFPLRSGGIDPSVVCGGVLEGGKDTCQGDSGGPIQIVLESLCMYLIVGVTSTGGFCGFAQSPALYTNIAYHRSWIESVVWPDLVKSL